MPYIKSAQRPPIDGVLDDLHQFLPDEGSLNYAITRIVDRWLRDVGANYKNLNAAIGIFECAKLELYRSVIAGYEDEKRLENGDVYLCRTLKTGHQWKNCQICQY